MAPTRLCRLLAVLPLLLPSPAAADETRPETVLEGLRSFFARTARDAGSFRPGLDPEYRGMSDSAYSDLAPVTYAVVLHRTFGWKLPHEEATRAFLLGRQQPDGAFVNVGGTADPASAQARVYNTTQGLVALHALGVQPRHDPLPVFAAPQPGPYDCLDPKMPPYAWPTYAPYNNYSRVAYPLAYPYRAWPFIGPPYPFPKVPLGWRSGTLYWQDGPWYFSSSTVANKCDWWRLRYSSEYSPYFSR